MGTDSIAKYLNVRTVMATLVLVIISLCGTIIVLKEGNLSAMVDQKIKAAFECAKVATAAQVEQLEKDKLDISVYDSDQRAIRLSLEQLKQNSDMLIRLQLEGRKASAIQKSRGE